MARLGVFCFPGTGHINPMTALARHLEQRGHKVIFFGIADTEPRIRAAGFELHLIGIPDYPPGTLQQLDHRLGELSGLATFRFTVERVKNTTRMVLRDGPAAVRSADIDALLIDEADMGGNVAEHLNLPFISIALFPPLLKDDCIPPFCFGWPAGQDPLSRLRNRLGMRLLSSIAAPIYAIVNQQRQSWGLKPVRHATESLSPLAQITQLPQALEFTTPNRTPNLHYTGPFVDDQQRPPIDFPWSQLDGRPLVYASLGTLQNSSATIFRTIAEACAPLNLQLVLTLGGGLDPGHLGPLPGNPIVVSYAPQLQLLRRAAAVITHAGLNTVLESLAQGVPLVAIPLGNDQPGVATRLAEKNAGIVIPKRKLTPQRLRSAVQSILEDPTYRTAAQNLQSAINQTNALETATDIIEATLKINTGNKPGAPSQTALPSEMGSSQHHTAPSKPIEERASIP